MTNRILKNLRKAKLNSCNCATKTPEIEYHREDCLYRVLREAEIYIMLMEEVLNEIEISSELK